MRLEWDAEKERRNRAKHKVSFQTAALVFEDQCARSRPDRIVEGEERWVTMGVVGGTFCSSRTRMWRKAAMNRSGSFPHARRPDPREERMKKATKHRAQADTIKELAGLKRMKDEEIDFSDIPEITDWSKAVVGKFYRPIKKLVTVRLDTDVLAWLRSGGKGYQTKLNGLLREAMDSERRA